MGSPASEADRGTNEDQVDVTLTQGFWLGQYEVTQREWRDVMGSEPWNGENNVKQGDQIAATWLSWEDAVAFCDKFTIAERESGRLPDDWEYTLPTEAQREYACRAETTEAYSFGDSASALSDYAWWGGIIDDGNAKGERYAHAVGLKQPNAWNLHDMHGNVYEWCSDWYADSLIGGSDPRGPPSGSFRAYRGGSWSGYAKRCRSAFRIRDLPDARTGSLGFRVLRGSSAPTVATPEKPPPPTPVPVAHSGTRAGEEESNNSLQMKFVWCPPGTFTMGSPPNEPARGNNEDQVDVTLTQGFWLGKYEVTQREWREVMLTAPWKNQQYVKEGDQIAATYVNWDDAVIFCEKLTASERESGRLPDDWVYTLPTEAQWEYACRAGTTTAYNFGDSESTLSEYAWWGGIAGGGNTKADPHAYDVGLKRSNAWNLHDMHGNVWEWCRDSYTEKLPGGTDPRGPSSGSARVFRGGSWGGSARSVRSAYRRGRSPGGRDSFLGFRVLRSSVGSSVATFTTPVKPPSPPPVPAIQSDTRAGEEQSDNSLKMKLVWCPPGKFMMGSPAEEVGRQEDEKQLPMTLTQGFWLGKYEVTQKQWRDLMGGEPWKGNTEVKVGDQLPATNISWLDAVEFCHRLTDQERSAGRLQANWEYGLPTAVQWEYSCRAGTTTRFSSGDNETELLEMAWFTSGSTDTANTTAQPVGTKKANMWGLHDMHGNVKEWCRDSSRSQGRFRYFEIYNRGSHEVRGGSRSDSAAQCRSASISMMGEGEFYPDLGFRVSIIPDRSFRENQNGIWDSNCVWMRFTKKYIYNTQFTMGSTRTEPNRDIDEDLKRVRLSRTFWVGTHEVTQRQWKTVMNTTPWEGKTGVLVDDRCPATFVNYADAVDFCSRLTERERVADRIPDEWRFALPTEAQWEYARRGRRPTKFDKYDQKNLGDFAWFKDSLPPNESYAHPVGTKKRDYSSRMFDMSGNVREWCSDWYARKFAGGTDPTGPASGSMRVTRGGGWSSDLRDCRPTAREPTPPSEKSNDLGFRVVIVN